MVLETVTLTAERLLGTRPRLRTLVAIISPTLGLLTTIHSLAEAS